MTNATITTATIPVHATSTPHSYSLAVLCSAMKLRSEISIAGNGSYFYRGVINSIEVADDSGRNFLITFAGQNKKVLVVI